MKFKLLCFILSVFIFVECKDNGKITRENSEVIEVNQKSENNRQVRNSNGIVIWIADDSRTDTKYVALFNLNNEMSLKISISWKEIGLNGDFVVRDLWEKKELGNFKMIFQLKLKLMDAC